MRILPFSGQQFVADQYQVDATHQEREFAGVALKDTGASSDLRHSSRNIPPLRRVRFILESVHRIVTKAIYSSL
jgi:hypothetical protein